jgi:hypothetical protein
MKNSAQTNLPIKVKCPKNSFFRIWQLLAIFIRFFIRVEYYLVVNDTIKNIKTIIALDIFSDYFVNVYNLKRLGVGGRGFVFRAPHFLEKKTRFYTKCVFSHFFFILYCRFFKPSTPNPQPFKTVILLLQLN